MLCTRGSSQGLLQFLLLHSVDIFMDIEFE